MCATNGFCLGPETASKPSWQGCKHRPKVCSRLCSQAPAVAQPVPYGPSLGSIGGLPLPASGRLLLVPQCSPSSCTYSSLSLRHWLLADAPSLSPSTAVTERPWCGCASVYLKTSEPDVAHFAALLPIRNYFVYFFVYCLLLAPVPVIGVKSPSVLFVMASTGPGLSKQLHRLQAETQAQRPYASGPSGPAAAHLCGTHTLEVVG